MTRTYDREGYRRIRPSERSPGMTELQLPDGRCIQVSAFGPAADRAVSERAARHG